jgi:hypothetical protein
LALIRRIGAWRIGVRGSRTFFLQSFQRFLKNLAIVQRLGPLTRLVSLAQLAGRRRIVSRRSLTGLILRLGVLRSIAAGLLSTRPLSGP